MPPVKKIFHRKDRQDQRKIIKIKQENQTLTQKVHQDRRKIIKIKRENQILTQKVHMSEERIRGLELQSQSQERLMKEQKRNKDLLQRLEREKTLGIENYTMRSAPPSSYATKK